LKKSGFSKIFLSDSKLLLTLGEKWCNTELLNWSIVIKQWVADKFWAGRGQLVENKEIFKKIMY